ncbi:hypothetical protein EHEL_080010 [Encephalitozoon hellem ATCC 50504]|uniref:Uncharacterized protein n=1 Tax=Encephalitozoon hellem TaxID=27973 RepID=A0A9Q9C4T6_ENCHE|nr:uncharacterized protein EHEL_080010 [Encephalitozoon hellem ATCC 50504]AFM98707.1 hypothetical protein EHEL_080010 [Encephalitozoon hellem ATCC 50504]UTX43680.1 hypothetical protein GPU96_08g14480 [Encephalitozoon hellem]WEL39156.1 hypothetical protein PFJ87_08g00130 [Encephalitozoon hellem]|eukprot:XP_003887688.1 hypothetical protein EHEL_080010 [Encephalitozoon hellem ATCC 50504]
MGKLFKKFRIEKANERKKAKEKPKIKKTQEIKSHVKERSEIEKIFCCLDVSYRRKTGYRKIIALEEAELERNIFLISEKVLEVVVTFETVDSLFYSVLKRMVCLKNSISIHTLLIDYFLGSILCGVNYEKFGNFLLKHLPQLLSDNKTRILQIIPNGELKENISRLRSKSKYPTIKYQQKFTILRSEVITSTNKY